MRRPSTARDATIPVSTATPPRPYQKLPVPWQEGSCIRGRPADVADDALELGVGHEGRELPFEPNDAVTVRLGCAGRRDDAIGKGWIAHRPLERLLRTHRETDDRAQVRDLEVLGEQAMHGLDVVANGRDRKARAMERLRRIAR